MRTARPTPTAVPEADPRVVEAVAVATWYAERLLVTTSRDTHRAFTDRAFGLAGLATLRAARVPQAVHDGIVAGVYASVGLALRGTAEALDRAGARGVGPRLDDSPSGRTLQAAVNGLVGDRVHERHPHLAPAMSVRVSGRPVRLEADDVAAAFPRATDRIVVFLHGLCGHEGQWERRREQLGGTYGSRLEEQGWTPVYLRTNSGLPVAEAGVALTALLQRLVDVWPRRVRRLCLVGHSMGGLVARAGCAVATMAEDPWSGRLTDVVTLGTPHLGADLAVAARHGARLAALLPELAALGRAVDERSPGIRDLERGLPDVPPLDHVRYRLVAGGLGGVRGPLDLLLGDLMVRRGSATGAARRGAALFPDAHVLQVPNAGHLALLNHPEVCSALLEWLG